MCSNKKVIFIAWNIHQEDFDETGTPPSRCSQRGKASTCISCETAAALNSSTSLLLSMLLKMFVTSVRHCCRWWWFVGLLRFDRKLVGRVCCSREFREGKRELELDDDRLPPEKNKNNENIKFSVYVVNFNLVWMNISAFEYYLLLELIFSIEL